MAWAEQQSGRASIGSRTGAAISRWGALLFVATACGSSDEAALNHPGAKACASAADCLNGQECRANRCAAIDAGTPGRDAGSGGSGGSNTMSTGSGGSSLRSCATTADCVGDEICASNVCVVVTQETGGTMNAGSGGRDLGTGGIAGRTGAGGKKVGAGGVGAGGFLGSGGVVFGTGGTPFGTGGARPGSGGTSTGGASVGTGGAVTQCAADGASCAVETDCCGSPSLSVCTNLGSPYLTCTPVCTFDTDCASGCCYPLTNVLSACAPSSLCVPPCSGDLEPCTVNTDCCGYPDLNRCVDFGIGTGPVCGIVCFSGSDCASGCCDLLSSGYSVCGPC
jgi:hypothetical protein